MAGASAGIALLKPPWDTPCWRGRPVPGGHPLSPQEAVVPPCTPTAPHLWWDGDGGGGTHLPRQLVGLLGDDSLGGGYPQTPAPISHTTTPPAPPRLPQPRAGPPWPEHPWGRGTSPGGGRQHQAGCGVPEHPWGEVTALGPPPGGRVRVRGAMRGHKPEARRVEPEGTRTGSVPIFGEGHGVFWGGLGVLTPCPVVPPPPQPPTPSTGTPQSHHSQRRCRWRFSVSGSPRAREGGSRQPGLPSGCPPSCPPPQPQLTPPRARTGSCPLPACPLQAWGAFGERSSSSGRRRGSSPPRWATQEGSPPTPPTKKCVQVTSGDGDIPPPPPMSPAPTVG